MDKYAQLANLVGEIYDDYKARLGCLIEILQATPPESEMGAIAQYLKIAEAGTLAVVTELPIPPMEQSAVVRVLQQMARAICWECYSAGRRSWAAERVFGAEEVTSKKPL